MLLSLLICDFWYRDTDSDREYDRDGPVQSIHGAIFTVPQAFAKQPLVLYPALTFSVQPYLMVYDLYR